MALNLINCPSPNHDARPSPPYMVIIHYTGMTSGSEAIKTLTDPVSKVSSHYTIDEDGSIYAHVDESRRAWHAGVSYWQGKRDINAASIGIEIVNPGHEFGYVDFTVAQIDSLEALLGDIKTRWTIKDAHILGHSDIAPSRKKDPGERFPWEQLAKKGHGIFETPEIPPHDIMGPALSIGDTGLGVFSLQSALGKMGYNILAGGPYDEETRVMVTAFQRHFVPNVIGTPFEGLADAQTRVTLMKVLRAMTLDIES
jgi:N-acetylmuramoyl-L-alanine amidase